MKNRIKMICFILTGVLMLSLEIPNKKLNKIVSNIWEDQELETKLIQVHDSSFKDFNQMWEISSQDVIIGYAVFNSAFGCRIGGCPAVASTNSLTYESFDYLIVYDSKLNIKEVVIVNYPGEYGYEICRQSWLKQFIGGKEGFKLNQNVDAIAGATVSASHLINGINETARFLEKQ